MRIRLALEPGLATAVDRRVVAAGASGWLVAEPVLGLAPARSEGWDTIYDGPAALGGGAARLRCRQRGGRYLVEVEGGGVFEVGPGEVVQRPSSPPTSLKRAIETVFGPPVVLAMAQAALWCVHASGTLRSRDGRAEACLFLGVSGSGKSTLAASFAEPSSRRGGWRRIADDVVPVVHGGEDPRVWALPRFPQLKLSEDEERRRESPERVAVAHVYVLSGAVTEDRVEIARLPPAAAALALVEHAVGTRLLAREDLRRHLDFIRRAAAACPVYVLRYPRDRRWLPRVRATIGSSLDAAASS